MQRHARFVIVILSLAAGAGVIVAGATSNTACAQGNACVASCRAAHSQCRIATKGSASCDAQLQACVHACVKP
jgi:hypothetical protein